MTSHTPTCVLMAILCVFFATFGISTGSLPKFSYLPVVPAGASWDTDVSKSCFSLGIRANRGKWRWLKVVANLLHWHCSLHMW